MKPTFKSLITAAIAGLLGLAASIRPASAGTVFFDNFNDQQNLSSGGSYTQTLAGSTTTTGGGTWLAGVETNGWGQRNWSGTSGAATPTSSNFLAFTPDPGRIYTVQATIDTTPLGGADPGGSSSWFALGFTSSQHNWNGVDGSTIDTGHLVRFSSNTVATVTYTLNGADLVTAGIGYVGWITDRAGVVNLTPSTPQVKIDNFSLISGVANPTVTYNGNGSDGGTVSTDGSSPYTHSATVTVLGAGSMTRSGYTFVGWNTAVDGLGINYSPGATFTIYDNTTLYAKWLSNSAVTLTYDGNGSTGGSAPVDPSSPYIGGSTVTVLGNTGTLTKNSYTFNGWNTAANGGGTNYNPAATFTINANTTLYARWTPGPDYVWSNGATTDAWNTTDANWSGATWSNSATNNAFFTTVGGNVYLAPGIVAGAVNVGNAGINFANLSLLDGGLAAASLTVQGNGGNGGNYGTNPTLTIDSAVTITGDAAAGRASLNISGGTFTANRIISSAAGADWARLVVSGGVVTATNGVDGSVYTSATFAIDLNGGELRTPSIRVADREAGTNNNAWLTFNGTTIKATGADNANFITLYGGGQNTYVASGGAIIDTNGRNIGIQVNLLNGGGGLTKDGAGTLTLSGTNTYSGATTVMTGTLEIGGNGGFDANTAGGQVTVDSGATLTISTSANNALAFQGSTPAWQVSGTLNITANNANSIPAAGIVLNNGTLTGTGTETTYGSLLAVNGTVNTITANGATNAISNSNFGIWNGVTLTLDTPQASDALTASTAFFNAASGTTGGLAKTGDGAVTLTGANTYQGNTTVSGGILRLSTAFLANGSTISIAAGAKLALTHGAGDTVDSLFLDGVQVPAGTYGSSAVTAVTLNHVDDAHFDAVGGTGYLIVLNGPPAGSDYETWGATYGLSAGSEGGDLDNDGLTNFQEYAFGLIPNSGSSVNPITIPLSKSAGTFTYTRRDISLQNPVLTYTVWTSTNLVNWTQESNITAVQTPGAPDVNGIQSVLVTLTPAPTAPKLFIQVRAE